MIKDKQSTFLRFVVLLAIGVFVFTVANFSKQQARNVADHRYQVETLTKESDKHLTEAALANRTRLDVDLCIVSVPPQTRTPEYVKACYDDAEKDSGVKIRRFGYGQ